MASKKSALEKYLDGLERKAKKAVTRKAKAAGKAAGRATGRAVKAGARAAVNRARVKPQQMIGDMRKAGWTPRQIQAKTGIPVRTQNDILKGRSNGQKWLQPLKEARKQRAHKFAPGKDVLITPVKSARREGEGVVRVYKTKTVLTVDRGTSQEWIRQQQRKAKGKVEVRYRKPKAAKQATPKATKATPPPRRPMTRAEGPTAAPEPQDAPADLGDADEDEDEDEGSWDDWDMDGSEAIGEAVAAADGGDSKLGNRVNAIRIA